MKDVTIDLRQYRSGGSRVFAGRQRGEEVRSKAGLGRLDLADVRVSVVIPDDTFSLTSFFFLGMFGPSIRALGRDGFRAKYCFSGPDFGDLIQDGIDEALRTSSPLRAA